MRRIVFPLVLVGGCHPGTAPAAPAHATSTHACPHREETPNAAEPAPAEHACAHHADAHHAGAHHAGMHGEGMHKDFSDVAHFARAFDDPARDAWQLPDQVISLLALKPGATVADVGAGTGYFEARLSAAVGATGKVLALDSEPNMVAHLRARAAEQGLTNVEARLVSPGEPGLAPASVDRILVVDTWHHLDERLLYAALLKRALRPGGLVAVVDFTAESEIGPPPEHRLSAGQIAAELTAAGFTCEVASESLPNQYVVLAHAP